MKYVITGGPNSGKTTLIKALEKKGYKVYHEVAREMLEKQPEIKDITNFQKELLKKTLERNQKIKPEEDCFLDIDLIEGIAYFKINNLKPPEWLLSEAKKARYDKVFFLQSNPTWVNDGIRIYKNKSKQIEKLIKEAYKSFGFKLIEVPWIKVEERVKLIEKEIQKGG